MNLEIILLSILAIDVVVGYFSYRALVKKIDKSIDPLVKYNTLFLHQKYEDYGTIEALTKSNQKEN